MPKILFSEIVEAKNRLFVRALISSEILLNEESVGSAHRVYIFYYNGEFDPGSGRTLAAGLTHASRRRR